MKKIAITGTMASGKSFVLSIINEQGFKTCSSDELVRKTLESNKRIRDYIFKYDANIENSDGSINKKLLAKYLFEDVNFGKKYKEDLYKEIANLRDKMIKQHPKEEFMFFEIPLLFENNLEKEFDRIILVKANQEDLEKRIEEKKRIIGGDVVDKMLERQIPNEKKEHLCHFVINSSNSKKYIEKKIVRIIENERNCSRY